MKLKKLTLKSGEYLFAFNLIVKALVQIVQLIILARYLPPEELGIIAILVMVSGLVQVLSDSGFAPAVIFDKEDKSRKSVISLAVAISALLVVITVVVVEVLDMLNFKHPSLNYMQIIASIFLIRGFSSVCLAYLQKDLRFDSLAKVELFSCLIYVVSIVYFTLSGYGVDGYIYSQYILASSMAIFSYYYSRYWVIPYRFEVDFNKIVPLLKYGGYQFLDSLVNYFSSQIDQMVIATNYGVKTLGIYANVRNLVFRPSMLVINPIINKVVFPKLCAKNSDSTALEQFESVFSILTVINVVIYMNFALNSNFVVGFVFGEGWVEYGLLLSLFAIYMLTVSFGVPSGLILKVIGKVKLSLYWNCGVTIIRLVSIIFLSSFEIEFMILGMIFVQSIIFVINTKLVISRYIAVSFKFVFLNTVKPVLEFLLFWVLINYAVKSLPVNLIVKELSVIAIPTLCYVLYYKGLVKKLF